MELELVIDVGAGEEASEGGGAHLPDADEVHVVGDGGGDGVDDVIGVAEAAEDGAGHFGAEFVVAVEADAAGVGIDGAGGGFGDVVEEDGEDEREGGVRGKEGEHEAGVNEDIALGVELGGLVAALEVDDFGEDDGHEAGVHQEVETVLAAGGKPEAVELVADAFGTDAGDEGGGGLEGGPGGGVDGEVEGGGEADGAEEAEVILLEAGGGIANGADDAGVEVGAAADVVDEAAGLGVEEEAVDGEVPAEGVLLGGGEGDGLGAAAVAIGAVGAEGGDLDPAGAGGGDDDDAEVGADELGAGEESGDLGRGGGGGDVVVLGVAAEEVVAHRAAGEVGLMAGLVEAVDDFEDVGGEGHGEAGSVAAERAGGKPRLSGGARGKEEKWGELGWRSGLVAEWRASLSMNAISSHFLKSVLGAGVVLLSGCQDEAQIRALGDQIRALEGIQAQTKAEMNRLQLQMRSVQAERDKLKEEREKLESQMNEAKKALESIQKDFADYKAQYKLSIRRRAPGMELEVVEVDGKKFERVRVRELTDVSLTFMHPAGTMSVPLKQLKPDLQKRLGFEQGVPVMAAAKPDGVEGGVAMDQQMAGLGNRIMELRAKISNLERNAADEFRKALAAESNEGADPTIHRQAEAAMRVQINELEVELNGVQKRRMDLQQKMRTR